MTGRFLAILLAIAALAVTALAQETLGIVYRDPTGRFVLQYPRRDWLAFPGGGSTLVTVAERRARATVQIEHQRLNQPVNLDENRDLVVQIESDVVRERQLKVTDLKPVTPVTPIPGAIVLEFQRPGAAGPERVRQVSLVRGQDLYRVLCIATVADFPKYEAAFDQVARSFSVTTK